MIFSSLLLRFNTARNIGNKEKILSGAIKREFLVWDSEKQNTKVYDEKKLRWLPSGTAQVRIESLVNEIFVLLILTSFSIRKAAVVVGR